LADGSTGGEKGKERKERRKKKEERRRKKGLEARRLPSPPAMFPAASGQYFYTNLFLSFLPF
jgi:hypothetical protein